MVELNDSTLVTLKNMSLQDAGDCACHVRAFFALESPTSCSGVGATFPLSHFSIPPALHSPPSVVESTVPKLWAQLAHSLSLLLILSAPDSAK